MNDLLTKDRLEKQDERILGLDFIPTAPWGTHICQLYDKEQDLTEVLVPYFKAGLENNEQCIWVVSTILTVEDAQSELAKVVPDLALRMEKGQMTILPYTDVYMNGSSFDGEVAMTHWAKKLEDAISAGYDGLRASGDSSRLKSKDWKSLAAYEAAVNKNIGAHKMLAICAYSLDRCSASDIASVVRNHPLVLVKRDDEWDVI